MNGRVRVILPGQFANLGTYDLDYIQSHYGAPASFVHAIAGAPYFTAGDVQLSGSVDQILQAMQNEINGDMRTEKQQFIALAQSWGLKAVTYEGGPDNGGGSTANLANRIAANRDPRMKDLIVQDVTQWRQLGGDLFLHYKIFSGYDQNGMWVYPSATMTSGPRSGRRSPC
jgi:hypothetical protein